LTKSELVEQTDVQWDRETDGQTDRQQRQSHSSIKISNTHR